jgi:hypothetical protein
MDAFSRPAPGRTDPTVDVNLSGLREQLKTQKQTQKRRMAAPIPP